MEEENSTIKDILKPSRIVNYIKTLKVDEDKRKTISSEMHKLIDAAKKARVKMKE